MKRCPECRRDYYDDTLLYCLEDGVALVQGSVPVPLAEADEPATAILSEPPALAGGQFGNESPTRAKINTTDQTAVLPTGRGDIVPKSRGFDKRLIAAPLLAILIAVAGFVGYRYLEPFGSTQINSIAVMPFVNESGNADIEYLSDGMTETLIRNLSQLPGLKVKARSSVFRYKGKETDARTIGADLGVQAILNGRVIQRGEQLSLNLELIDARTENVIWADQYFRKASDLVTLQNEIARDV
jgi:TolB-like protein